MAERERSADNEVSAFASMKTFIYIHFQRIILMR